MKPLFVSFVLVAASSAFATDEPASKADQPAPAADQSVSTADKSAPAPASESKESMRARMLEDAKRRAVTAPSKAQPDLAPTKLDKDSLLPAPTTSAAPAAPTPSHPVSGDAAPSPRLDATETAVAQALAAESVDPKSASAPAPVSAPKTATTAANAQAAGQPAAMLPKVEVQKARITVLDQQLSEQQKQIAREEKLTKPTELDKALNGAEVSKKLSILGGQSADYRAGNAAERVSILKEESDLLEAIAHTKDKKEKAELQKELDELRSYRRELEKTQR